MVSGEDGWTFEALYNMPIFLRNYYVGLMRKKRQAEQAAVGKGRLKDDKRPQGPAIPRK